MESLMEFRFLPLPPLPTPMLSFHFLGVRQLSGRTVNVDGKFGGGQK